MNIVGLRTVLWTDAMGCTSVFFRMQLREMRLGAISTAWFGLSSPQAASDLTISTSAPTIHDTLFLLTSIPPALKLTQ